MKKNISVICNLIFIPMILVGLGLVIYSFIPADLANHAGALPASSSVTPASSGTGYEYIGAGLSTTGMLGAGIGQGYAAGKAAEGVSRNPEAESKIRNMMIVGAAIAETSALYAFVIGILLVFVV